MSLHKYNYFFLLACCSFCACNDDDKSKIGKKQNKEIKLKDLIDDDAKKNIVKQKSVDDQIQEAKKGMNDFQQAFISFGISIKGKKAIGNSEYQKEFTFFSSNFYDELLDYQKKIIPEIVRFIVMNFDNDLQDKKTLNFETVNKYLERLKNAISKSIFVTELFSLANYLQVDNDIIKKWKENFPLEFLHQELLNKFGWMFSYFDLKFVESKDDNILLFFIPDSSVTNFKLDILDNVGLIRDRVDKKIKRNPNIKCENTKEYSHLTNEIFNNQDKTKEVLEKIKQFEQNRKSLKKMPNQ